MGKYSRLGKNTLLVFIGNIGSKAISFLMLPFYTKWLSVEDYGVTDIITIYATFLLGIVSACIAESIFIFPKGKSKTEQKQYFSTALGFSFISFSIAALLFFIANKGFNYFNAANSFAEYTWWIFWIMTATFLQNFMQQFSRSIDKVTVYAISGIVLTGFTAVLSFLLIPKYGVKGYLFSQILALLLAALYAFFHSKSFNYFSLYGIRLLKGKEMLHYSIPLIPNGIMWLLVSALNRPLLEYYYSLNEVGLFAVANKFPSILIVIFTVFMYSWQISVLEEFDKPNYKEFYNKILRLVFFVLILMSCVVTFSSKFLVSIIADEKFIEAYKILPLLTFAVLFSSLSSFAGVNFSAAKKSKYYFYSSIWGAVASVISNIVLVPIFSLYGAAMAVVISYFVMATFRIAYSWKYVKIEGFFNYAIQFTLNIVLIISTFLISDFTIKTTVFIAIVLALLLLNYKIILSVSLIYHHLKSKIFK